MATDITFTDSKTFDIPLPGYVVKAMDGKACSLVIVQDADLQVLHYYVNGVEATYNLDEFID